MTPEEIKRIFEDVVSENPAIPWWVYLLLAIITLATAYFGTYFAEKARGTAKKEDIEKLTTQVKDIEHSYNVLLEATRNTNQLRMAAVERRLQAHQEAYKLWRKMFSYVHDEKIYEIVQESQEWWNDNCLYLEPDARKAFFQCMVSSRDHEWYLENKVEADLIKENFEDIRTAGETIVAAVELPPLNETESFKRKNS